MYAITSTSDIALVDTGCPQHLVRARNCPTMRTMQYYEPNESPRQFTTAGGEPLDVRENGNLSDTLPVVFAVEGLKSTHLMSCPKLTKDDHWLIFPPRSITSVGVYITNLTGQVMGETDRSLQLLLSSLGSSGTFITIPVI